MSLQSWICTVRRHFSISGTAPVCSFPLVWNVQNTETKSSFLLFSWPQKLLYAWLLFGPGYSVQQHQSPELNEQVRLRFCISSLYLLQKLFGPKGIRGNTLICFEKWVREQSPHQLPSFITKQTTNTSLAPLRHDYHSPYCASERATWISLYL